MKRTLSLLLIFLPLFSFGSGLFADESHQDNLDPIAEVYKHSLIESLFVIETDEESAQESLNRVSGNIDRGFSSPEQTYQSEHHTKVDPLKEHSSK